MAAEEDKIALPLYIESYKTDSLGLGSFGLTNLYPEVLKGEVDNPITLVGTPGLLRLDSIGTGPHRGFAIHNGSAYIVSGNKVYKYDSNMAVSLMGTLNTSAGMVSMSSNGVFGNQLTIVDGVNGYICNGSSISTIVDVDFPTNPIKTEFMDGFTIVLQANTDKWYISDFYDSSSWTSISVARAERDADNLLAVKPIGRQLWLLGEKTAEIWNNTGDDFPFSPIANGFIERGILAPNSAVNCGDYGLVWLSQNKFGQGELVQTKGLSAVPITPPGILSIWRTYTRLDDAIAFVYQEHGHTFYQITFPTDLKTWVVDLSTMMWHERKSNNSRHYAQSYMFFNNMHIVGDYRNGNIYKYDLDTFTDNGDTIRREVTTHHVTDKRQLIRHRYVELEGETGVGLLSGQGTTPYISMEMSDDGGHTYSNVRKQKWGAQGEYFRCARWPLLGISRNRVYKFSMSDPIKYRLKRLILCFQDSSH